VSSAKLFNNLIVVTVDTNRYLGLNGHFSTIGIITGRFFFN
jgi:hypothetical protein